METVTIPESATLLPNKRSSCHGAKVRYAYGLRDGSVFVAITCMRCGNGCLALDGTPDGTGGVIEAIAQVWLPEAVRPWLDDHGWDAVDVALQNSYEGGKPPDADWIIEKVLETYPAELTEAAFRNFWEHVPPELIKSITDELHDIALHVCEDEQASRKNARRWNGLTASMFGRW